MNCQEVQPALSEYLEKSLDAIRMKSIETHLVSCPLCRAEADGLTDCIQQITELPLVDPPLGFTQRVMAHVREIETKPSLWQRVFTPLRTNAPIQATAVVFIAVLAVFVYQKEAEIKNSEPARPNTPIPPMSLSFDKPAGSQANQSAEPPRVAVKRENSKGAAAQPPTIEARAKSIAEIASLKDRKPATPQPSADVQAESAAGDVKDAVPRRAPIQAQEVATGMESLRPSGESFGLGPTLGGSVRPGFFLPERALSPITEPSADVEFVVRRRDLQRRDQKEGASSDLQRERAETGIATAAATAKQSAPAPSPQNTAMSVREVRWFAVPADRYDQFRKELVAEATIESEKAMGAMEKDFALKSNRELLIKVIILSPADR
jgi:hypothetical protein